MNEKVKCLIIGAGPAGYTAAIYTSRADLKPVLYEGTQPGGQLTITTDVENFPGFENPIPGPELMERMRNQAIRLGTDIRTGTVSKVDLSKNPFLIEIDNDKIIFADRIIIATGASAKWLNIPSETKFRGAGVSACATCDGFFYRNQEVAIVGGGDTAAEEATYLAKLCSKVHLIHRRNELRASKAMQQKVLDTKNIIIHFNYVIDEIFGDKFVEGIKIKSTINNEIKTINVTGVFIAIGHKPNTDIFKEQLELDNDGYIITKPNSTETSVKGVFAAGDVQDKIYRQAITAAASGCMAAIELERSLH